MDYQPQIDKQSRKKHLHGYCQGARWGKNLGSEKTYYVNVHFPHPLNLPLFLSLFHILPPNKLDTIHHLFMNDLHFL